MYGTKGLRKQTDVCPPLSVQISAWSAHYVQYT